ncbi:MAG: tetratricopeptide repeat protein [Bacteroidaceae bacterium]|nr:tetratricopeptide repeat protein [Bacteroidaceae bacterium]
MCGLLWCCLAATAQTRFDYFYLEAEKYRLAEDYTTAAELYRHCLDINPDAAEATYHLGIIHVYLREDSVALALLKRATELAPDNPWYLETLAAIYLGQRDTEEVIPVLERMAAIQTRRSDILERLAAIYHTVGRTEDAIATLNRIELLEGKSAQLSVTKSEYYMEMEQAEQAHAELQALLDEFPHDMNTKIVVGNEYRKAGDMERANALYQEVQRKEPTNAYLQIALLDYYESAHDTVSFGHLRDSLLYAPSTEDNLRVMLMRDYIEKVRRDTTLRPALMHAFDVVLTQPQKNAQILILKAAYQSFVKVDEAALDTTLHRILDVEPGNQLALSELLKHYASRNDFEGMEDICRRGVNYRPEELGYPYYLALALIQQDKTREATEALEQGLRTKGDDEDAQLVSDMFSILGDLYAKESADSAYEKTFAAYDSALVYRDDNASVLNNYAYYLSLRDEQLDRAEEMSYRAIKAEPNNLNYLDTYAWILFMKKDYAAARIYMDKVVRPTETDEELLADEQLSGVLFEHAGDIYIQNGQPDVALRFWRLAIQRNDENCTPLLQKKIKKKKYLAPSHK